MGLHAFTAEGPGSIPDQGTEIPQAELRCQKKKKNGLNGGCQELGRKGSGELLFNGNTVSVSQDEKDLLCDNVNILTTSEL